jgi:NitT/TauT family transport system substrate-binding protein
MLLLPLSSHAEEWKLARLSFSSGWDALPAIVAIERGFFAQEGLVISGLPIPSAEAVTTSLVQGSTDFAAVPQRTLLAMAAAQLHVKVISMNGWGTELELIVPQEDATTKSVADLKGKTIAVGMASEAYPALIRLLNKAKLRSSDVKIKTLPADALVQVFSPKERQADAVFEARHFTMVLTKNGKGRTVLTPQEVVDKLGLIGAAPLLIRSEMIEKEPETVQRFTSAWVKALRYIKQDPDDAARLLMIFFHRQGVRAVSEELTKSWIALTRYDRFVWTPAEIADAEYNGWGLKEGGLLKASPKLESYIENRFAQTAMDKLAAATAAPKSKGRP